MTDPYGKLGNTHRFDIGMNYILLMQVFNAICNVTDLEIMISVIRDCRYDSTYQSQDID